MLFVVRQGQAEAHFHPAGRAVTGIKARSWLSQCHFTVYYHSMPPAPTINALSIKRGQQKAVQQHTQVIHLFEWNHWKRGQVCCYLPQTFRQSPATHRDPWVKWTLFIQRHQICSLNSLRASASNMFHYHGKPTRDTSLHYYKQAVHIWCSLPLLPREESNHFWCDECLL